jgi:membrane-associated phospholipid phosphatase
MDLHGIGPAGAARILADVGDVRRFPDRNHDVSWTGTAHSTPPPAPKSATGSLNAVPRSVMTSGRVPADVAAGLGGVAVGAVVTALVHARRTRPLVQRVDDGWYQLVQRTGSAPREAASRTLDIGFGTTADWTVRVAVTAQLLRTRRWASLAGWAATVALGEVSVGPLKSVVNRPRPGAPMTRTTMASYPSGHALAAATTAPGIVMALVPPGRARRRLLAVAVPLAGVTALSRTFLNAHWLSDVVGGFALGAGYALAVPGLVDLVWPSTLGTPVADPSVFASADGGRSWRPPRRWMDVEVSP